MTMSSGMRFGIVAAFLITVFVVALLFGCFQPQPSVVAQQSSPPIEYIGAIGDDYAVYRLIDTPFNNSGYRIACIIVVSTSGEAATSVDCAT